MSRKRKRLDANHAEIRAALEACGYRVVSLSGLGGGVPDLLTCRRGQLELVEVKSAQGKLRPEQSRFQADGWPVRVICSVLEVR